MIQQRNMLSIRDDAHAPSPGSSDSSENLTHQPAFVGTSKSVRGRDNGNGRASGDCGIVAIGYSAFEGFVISLSPGAALGLLIGDAYSEFSGYSPPPLENNRSILLGMLAVIAASTMILARWGCLSETPWYKAYWDLGTERSIRINTSRQALGTVRGGAGVVLFFFGGLVGPILGIVAAIIVEQSVRRGLGWQGSTLDNSYGVRRIDAGIIAASSFLALTVCRAILRRGIWSMAPIDPVTGP